MHFFLLLSTLLARCADVAEGGMERTRPRCLRRGETMEPLRGWQEADDSRDLRVLAVGQRAIDRQRRHHVAAPLQPVFEVIEVELVVARVDSG